MIIVIASNNSHKLREFAEILSGHEVVGPAHFGIRFEHEETGDTFAANSLGKAQTMYRLLLQKREVTSGFAVVADDSGIVVPALGGEPGIYSARYGSVPGGSELDDNGRNLLLLKNMRRLTDRSAYYVCCMTLMMGHERFVSVQETWAGIIAGELSGGKAGFGYDPLFIVPEYGKTVADIGDEIKSKISHRAKATKVLQKYLQDL